MSPLHAEDARIERLIDGDRVVALASAAKARMEHWDAESEAADAREDHAAARDYHAAARRAEGLWHSLRPAPQPFSMAAFVEGYFRPIPTQGA